VDLRLGRRAFLTGGLATLGVGLAMPAFGAATSLEDRSLGFYNTHTDERLVATYWRQGAYDRGALKDIDFILRDFRTGDVAPIERKLLDLLVVLHHRTGSRKPFQIISGYRSAHTNAVLAAASGGVAKRSLHMDAKAIDVRLADIALSDLRDNAIALQAGGVGFYPGSNFVHVDTGRVRRW
jgi:uncharacterized protein YcbK (DUF882 family)